MKHRLEAAKRYFLAFLQVQCLLSLVSLPVLVAWGLPISLMTAVGNFIFNPFVTAFLFCSSIIFFTELLHIPNSYLIVVLDWIVSSWMYCLSFGLPDWLIGFPVIMLPVLICLALLALLSLQHFQLGKPGPYIAICCCALIALATIRIYLPKPARIDINCNRSTIALENKTGKIHLIDENNMLSKHKNIGSWINYTLLPKLLQNFGTQSIETITLPYQKDANATTEYAIELLSKECSVKNIYRLKPKRFDKKKS